ncbi:MAG: SRPBCC family protein [Trueperaceae bacterium]|nr:SRPBCC family protein [Trueperaceae bacterium]
MVEIHVERTLEVPAQRVWEALRSFEGIETYLPMIARSEVRGSGAGAVRVCTTQDGGSIQERLESLDDAAMRLVYTIVDGPMPIEDYRSTMHVRAAGDERCTVSWSCTFEAAPEAAEELRGMFTGVYTDGLAGLEKVHAAR